LRRRQIRRLRAAYPVGSDCRGSAPIPRGQLPVRHLVQFPLLYPHRLLEKTPFGTGRLPRAPSHLATISPRFIPKRNPQEIPALQNQPQTLRLFRYLSTGESGMNLPLSSLVSQRNFSFFEGRVFLKTAKNARTLREEGVLA